MKSKTLLFALCMVLTMSVADAHIPTGLPGGFGSGFRHPFAGLDHLLAMVAVGVWGAVLGPPLLYALPIVFPLMMVGGAALGMLGVPMPSVEIGVAVSVLVLGACIAFSVRAPVWAASVIVATFAVFHGYAHGQELPSAADPLGYSAGFVLATGLLHLAGVALGSAREYPGGVAVMRLVGATIALVGIAFVGLAVRV